MKSANIGQIESKFLHSAGGHEHTSPHKVRLPIHIPNIDEIGLFEYILEASVLDLSSHTIILGSPFFTTNGMSISFVPQNHGLIVPSAKGEIFHPSTPRHASPCPTR